MFELLLAALVIVLVGLVSVVIPLRFLGIKTRPQGLLVILLGVAVSVFALNWGEKRERVSGPLVIAPAPDRTATPNK